MTNEKKNNRYIQKESIGQRLISQNTKIYIRD